MIVPIKFSSKYITNLCFTSQNAVNIYIATRNACKPRKKVIVLFSWTCRL